MEVQNIKHKKILSTTLLALLFSQSNINVLASENNTLLGGNYVLANDKSTSLEETVGAGEFSQTEKPISYIEDSEIFKQAQITSLERIYSSYNNKKEDYGSSMLTSRANVSAGSITVTAVTEQTVKLRIKINSSENVEKLSVAYWRPGNYDRKMSKITTTKSGTNEFDITIWFSEIIGGSENISVGLHPVVGGVSYFVGDFSIKLDNTAPNLSAISSTAYSNKSSTITVTATDELNIIEKMYFYDKSGAKTSYDTYSNPKILFIYKNGVTGGSIEDKLNIYSSVTKKEVSQISTLDDLLQYDVIIYDGVYAGMDEGLGKLLYEGFASKDFSKTINVITNFNDNPQGMRFLGTNGTSTGSYTFQNHLIKEYAGGIDYTIQGRLNRFAYMFEGMSESDDYWKIYVPTVGSYGRPISKLVHSDGSESPGVVFASAYYGNKWIHVQGMGLLGRTGAINRAIDEMMYGKFETRQVYKKTFEVTENGTYYIEVEDFSRNKTKKQVVVNNIDKVAPSLTITGNSTNWTNGNVTLKYVANDNTDAGVAQGILNGGSGMSKVKLPNNTTTTSASGDYIISANGTYTFTATDKVGNIATKTVTVTNIDKTNPTATVSGNPTSWTKNSVTLTITGADSQSGVKSITKPDGTVVNGSSTTYTVSANGNYTFKITDNAGNVLTQTVIVSKIDKTAPTATVTGNPTSWTKNNATLTITGADSQSGVKQITLPNGQIVTGSSTTYTVTANGNYTFKVMDNLGNERTQTVSVTKIDKANPTATVTGNPTNWTNGNATLTITGDDSQSGVKSITKPDGTVVTGSSTTYTVSANGTYKFLITDNAGNVLTHNVSVTKIDKANPTATVSGNPTAWTKNNATLTITGADSGSGVKQIEKPDGTIVIGSSTTYTVTANGNYTFKITDNVGNVLTQTVNVSKIDKTNPTATVTGNPTSWTKNNATLTITGADSASGVKQIELPNGQVVNGSSTTYTVSGNGNYTFKVTDNVGNVLTQTVNVSKIDKTNPTATVTGNPTSWTKNNATLTITGADTQSGVKQIEKPDGTVVTGTSTTYTVSANGNYTFKITDNVGNVLTQTVNVSKIDKTNPTISITGNPTTWTNKDVTLTITGSDTGGGVKQITLPNGTVVTGSSTTYTVTTNGNYTFKVTDNAGNEVTQTVNVSKIDKTKPTISITGNPTSWTNKDVTLTVAVSDSQSGVKQITLPNGQVVTNSNTTYTVSANGNYTFKVLDNAGNETTQTVSVTKMDKTNPTINITGNPTSWTKNNVTLTITGADSASGVKQITLPNGQVITNSNTTYTVSANGNYTFKVLDNAGNEVTQTVSVTKIDKTNPTILITGNPTSWTKNNVTLTITGADSASGVKQITLPNGSVVSGSSATYTVSANGNYVFKVTDHAGNEISQTVSVTKIDKTNPTATVTGNPTSWTKNNATLTITGADTQSGVKQITKPDGTVVNGTSTTYTVSANGNYKFLITDNAGNVLTHNVSVTKIDKSGPVISHTLTPNTWTNGNVTINLNVNDVGVGLKEIHMPNGTVVSNSTASYTVSKNGAYYFKAVDNLGNETILPILVTKIDVKAPTLNINNNQNWTNQDVQINISGTD